MSALSAVFDNPILIKHVRSRLRPETTVGWVLIVLVLAICIVWAGETYSWIGSRNAVSLMLGLQLLALTFGGANQLNTSLGGVRETGLIDFHRVAPLPPSLVALGFFLGAPIREYLLAALTLPLAAYSAAQVESGEPGKGLVWLAQLEVALLMITWLVHALTMLGCMTRSKPRGSVLGAIAMVILVFYLGYVGLFGIFFGSRWLLEEQLKLNLFGYMVPWLAWLLMVGLPILGFLGLAIARKMGAERAHAYTKRQALACMATLTTLTVGGLWDLARHLPPVPPFEPTVVDVIMLTAVYVLAILTMVLAVTITPSADEYVKGLRRAARAGQRRSSPWSDAGSNRLALFALCALALVGATVVVHGIGRQPFFEYPGNTMWVNDPRAIDTTTLTDARWVAMRKAALSRPIAIAVLTAAYFGLGYQFFSLRTRTSGAVLTALFLFFAWLVPLLVGAIVGISGTTSARDLAIFALSPLFGIALSSGLGKPPGVETIQLAALAPPLTFAFLLNYLLVVTQRKIDRRLQSQAKGADSPPDRAPSKAVASALDDL